MILFRRIQVGLLMLAGLGFMGLAASTFAQGQEKKDASGNPVDWNEKKFATEIDGKKWEDVFTWLADQADLPFIYGKYKAPAGTIKITVPKNRKFSLLELYDIINERLQAHEQFTLLRSDVSLSLVPADEPIPASMVPRIARAELPERGRTEIVELVVQLKGSLNAEEFAASAKRLLGPFAQVTPLPEQNKLIVRADVATLRRHVPEWERGHDEKGNPVDDHSAHTWTHKCKYVRAASAEVVLTKALGQSRQIIETKLAPTPMGQPGAEPGPRPPGGATSRKVREHIITSEKASNTVIITGPTDKIEQAKTILKELDVARNPGDKGLLPTSPQQFEYHDLAGGNSEIMSKLISDIFKADDSIRISIAGPARLYVWADPQTHYEINAIVTKPPPAVVETVSISLNRLDATKLAESLKVMIQGSKSGSPFIEADPDQNSIRVRGTPQEIKDVRAIISVLDGDSTSQGGGKARDSVVITLEKGSGATLAEAVYLIFGKLRPDVNVNKVLPGQLDDSMKIDFRQPEKKPEVKPEVKPVDKKITRLTPDKLREAIYMNGKEVPVIHPLRSLHGQARNALKAATNSPLSPRLPV